MIELDLPIPPSANNLFVNRRRGGRHISPEYREWRRSAGWAIQLERPGMVRGQVHITLTVAENKRRDIDNCSKAVLDLLVTNGVIEADNMRIVRAVDLRIGKHMTGVHVKIEAAE